MQDVPAQREPESLVPQHYFDVCELVLFDLGRNCLIGRLNSVGILCTRTWYDFFAVLSCIHSLFASWFFLNLDGPNGARRKFRCLIFVIIIIGSLCSNFCS